MKLSRILGVAVAVLACATFARAVEYLPGGYIKTGDGTRVKKVAMMKVQVYDITHSMKQVPSPLTPEAVIDADVDKKFDWVMLRGVDAKKLEETMRDAYHKNGFNDDAKINQFLAPFRGGLSEGAQVQIYYDAPTKTTTMVTPNGRATIPGTDFMKATWRIWFGNIDQPDLTRSLLNAR